MRSVNPAFIPRNHRVEEAIKLYEAILGIDPGHADALHLLGDDAEARGFELGDGRETCGVGVPVLMHGAGVKITEDMIPNVTGQPELMHAAMDAGKLLGKRLATGHERSQVTLKMQARMMSALGESA